MTFFRALAAGVLAVAVLAACGGQKPQRGPVALDVDVAPAQRQDIATFLTLDGQIAPLQESTLSFQQSGPVSAVYVNQGDRVSAGQLLARIDDSTLRAQLAQEQAQIAQSAAQAQSSALNVPITQANTSQAVQSGKAALLFATPELQVQEEIELGAKRTRLMYSSHQVIGPRPTQLLGGA